MAFFCWLVAPHLFFHRMLPSSFMVHSEFHAVGLRESAGLQRRPLQSPPCSSEPLSSCAVPRRAAGSPEEPSLREVAKAEVLRLADEFRAKQEMMWNVTAELEAINASKSKSSLLNADSFASQQIMLSDELEKIRNETVKAIRNLAEFMPLERPMSGWQGYGGVSSEHCALNGTWKLIFTDAADATFKRGQRGDAFTFQELDSAEGWFVNCVNFSNPESKLKGFRVFVEGQALSDTEMQLLFRKVKLLRRSRFPKLFGVITIPLPPPGLLRSIGRFFARAMGGKVNPSDRGAGFTQLYLDSNLRAHETFDGLFFVQKRLS